MEWPEDFQGRTPGTVQLRKIRSTPLAGDYSPRPSAAAAAGWRVLSAHLYSYIMLFVNTDYLRRMLSTFIIRNLRLNVELMFRN